MTLLALIVTVLIGAGYLWELEEASRKNYGQARELLSRFLDDARAELTRAPEPASSIPGPGAR